MPETKSKVNWTIDKSIIVAIKRRVDIVSRETGMKVSESAIANKLLKERLEELTPVKMMRDDPHYEDISDE